MSFYVYETNHTEGVNDVEKVKLTREQAGAIERIRSCVSDSMIVRKKVNGGWDLSHNLILNKLPLDELIKVLYTGYEVEPEYKVGDWVVMNNHVVKIERIQYENKRVQYATVSNWQPVKGIDRRATPEEIKAEKEHRLWKSTGREISDFKIGDVITWDKGKGEKTTLVTSPFGDGVYPSEVMELYSDGGLIGFYPAESFVSFEEGDSDD